jgi:hypothetical protein
MVIFSTITINHIVKTDKNTMTEEKRKYKEKVKTGDDGG